MTKIWYPPYVQWEVTNRCNHNCIHCYNYWRTDINGSTDDCKNIDLILNKIIENKPVRVVLTGGEPTLLFEKIRNAIEKLRKNKIEVSINTNAVVITEEMASFFARNNVGCLISFPSSDSLIFEKIVGRDSFNKVVKNMRILQRYNVRFSTNTVVSKLNLYTIYETFKFLNQLGVVSCQMALAGKPINASLEFNKFALERDDWKIISSQAIKYCKEFNKKIDITDCLPRCTYESLEEYTLLKSRTCSAGLTGYAITVTGDVKACPRGEDVYGNILDEPLSSIYDKMESWRNETYIPQECKRCKQKYTCRGGCRMIGYSTTKKYDSFLDIANIENTPILYSEPSKKSYMENDKFCLNKNAIFLNEKSCVRVQVTSKCIFISREFADFLKNHLSFTKKELMNECENCYQIDYALNALIDNYIIIKQK